VKGSGSSQLNNFLYSRGNLYFTAQTASAIGNELYTTGADFTEGIATGTTAAAAHLSVVYPNPARDLVTVKGAEKIISLRLNNSLGMVGAKTTEATMNVSAYAAGIYSLEIVLKTMHPRIKSWC